MLRRVGRLGRVELSAAMVAFIVATTAATALSTSAAELTGESRVIAGAGVGFGAGTLEGSLVLAYQNNPQLNSQRAATRAADENVTTALAGYRPRVSGTSSLTEQYLDTLAKTTTATGAPVYTQNKG